MLWLDTEKYKKKLLVRGIEFGWGENMNYAQVKWEKLNGNSDDSGENENKAVPNCKIIYPGKNCFGSLKKRHLKTLKIILQR